jgi:hypothetical protein
MLPGARRCTHSIPPRCPLVLAAAITPPRHPRIGAGGSSARPLMLEERLAYQHAVEAVYWQPPHLARPKNGQPKPALDAVLPAAEVTGPRRRRVAPVCSVDRALAAAIRRANCRPRWTARPPTRAAELLRRAVDGAGHRRLRDRGNDRPPRARGAPGASAFERDSRFAGQSFDAWWQANRAGFPAALDEANANTPPFLAPDAPTADSLGADAENALPKAACHAATIWTGAGDDRLGAAATRSRTSSASGAALQTGKRTPWRLVAGFRRSPKRARSAHGRPGPELRCSSGADASLLERGTTARSSAAGPTTGPTIHGERVNPARTIAPEPAAMGPHRSRGPAACWSS